MSKKHDWQNPDDVKAGHLYIAWITGTQLPHFLLLAKNESRKKPGVITWLEEQESRKIPRQWIKAVHELPDPKELGKDWMEPND